MLTYFRVDKKTRKINSLFWFFNIGLSGKDGVVEKKQMKTLDTLLKDNNHTEVGIISFFTSNPKFNNR